jgi:hypothetical protein
MAARLKSGPAVKVLGGFGKKRLPRHYTYQLKNFWPSGAPENALIFKSLKRKDNASKFG